MASCRADTDPHAYHLILDREAKIAAAMWRHESKKQKHDRLIEATRETGSWIDQRTESRKR